MSKQILLCKPTYFQIEYEINPFMKLANRINNTNAVSAWDQLVTTIKGVGSSVELIEPVAGCPDMVFTANGGLVVDNQVILSQMCYQQRAAEETYFEAYFKSCGFEILPKASGYFEGAADAFHVGDAWLVSTGFRSTRDFFDSHAFFTDKKKIVCTLVDPHFYHLDTCFTDLGEGRALWYPQAFDEASQKSIKAHFDKLFSVPDAEAMGFACNAIVVDEHIIMAANNPKTQAYCESLGLTVHPVDMSEFLKAGGACACCVLML